MELATASDSFQRTAVQIPTSPDALLIGLPALPVAAARPISLSASQRHRLKKTAHGHKTAYQARMRAQIVLHAARGCSNARIARETGLRLDTVRTWRDRFAEHGLPGPTNRKRTGRPPSFDALDAAQAKALACPGCPPRRACHCRAGRARNRPPN